jgi:hypothetical protein
MVADLRIRGVSPMALRAGELRWWLTRFAFTCTCNDDVRLETDGHMVCGRCDAPVLSREVRR